MLCPVHNTEMLPSETKYGKRFSCSAEGCTMASWAGETSTPADEPTRKARIKAHQLFDLLWKTKKMSRKEAYRWLQKTMNLPPGECHIGMFTLDQCRQVIDKLNYKQEAQE
jgi:hypothetical protein